MPEYTLSIITPQGKIFEEPVKSFIVPGEEGFFEILAGHAPILALVTRGVVTITQASKRYMAIGAGVLEVNSQHHCLLLVDFASWAKSLAEAAERLQRDKSEIFLKSR